MITGRGSLEYVLIAAVYLLILALIAYQIRVFTNDEPFAVYLASQKYIKYYPDPAPLQHVFDTLPPDYEWMGDDDPATTKKPKTASAFSCDSRFIKHYPGGGGSGETYVTADRMQRFVAALDFAEITAFLSSETGRAQMSPYSYDPQAVVRTMTKLIAYVPGAKIAPCVDEVMKIVMAARAKKVSSICDYIIQNIANSAAVRDLLTTDPRFTKELVALLNEFVLSKDATVADTSTSRESCDFEVTDAVKAMESCGAVANMIAGNMMPKLAQNLRTLFCAPSSA